MLDLPNWQTYMETFLKLFIAITISLECCCNLRRQFNHFQEYLNEQKALRQHPSDFKSYMQQKKKGSDEYLGPSRTIYYNPTYGYEPYWQTGDWVFDRTKKKGNKTVAFENCGQNCFVVYESYGPVCARHYDGTYRGFANICALRNYDCNDRDRWRIIHRGYCRAQPKWYPYPGTHMASTRFPITRALNIIAAFSKKYPGVGDVGARRDMRRNLNKTGNLNARSILARVSSKFLKRKTRV